MPIYEYFCSKCKTESEELLNASESTIVFCKTCGKQLKKIISMVNFKCERADGVEVKKDD